MSVKQGGIGLIRLSAPVIKNASVAAYTPSRCLFLLDIIAVICYKTIMISLVSRFSPDIQQGFYALQRSVAINPIEQKLINNLKSLQSEKTLAKEKPKTIQQPAKTNNEVNAPYGLLHLSSASSISKKNAISNTNKNSDSTLHAAKDKIKTSTSFVADTPAAKLRNADILREATLAPAQPAKQNTDATTTDTKTQTVNDHAKIDASAVADDPAATLKKADIIRKATPAPSQSSAQDIQDAASTTATAQIELLKKNQNTQNGNKDHLGSKIDLSA